MGSLPHEFSNWNFLNQASLQWCMQLLKNNDDETQSETMAQTKMSFSSAFVIAALSFGTFSHRTGLHRRHLLKDESKYVWNNFRMISFWSTRGKKVVGYEILRSSFWFIFYLHFKALQLPRHASRVSHIYFTELSYQSLFGFQMESDGGTHL